MMQRMMTVLAALVLLVSVTFGAPGGIPQTGVTLGTKIYSPVVGSPIFVKVTGNVSGQTQFSVSDGQAGGSADIWLSYGDDAFNQSWVVEADKCANITRGSVMDITDYVASTGTFTTIAAGANYAAGDRLKLVYSGLGSDLEGPGSGINGSVATGVISACTNSTTVSSSITAPSFAGLNTTLYSQAAGGQPQFAVRVDQVDAADEDTVLLSMWRPLVSLSSAGVMVVKPAIVGDDGTTGVLDAGDMVSIVPMDYVNPPSSSKWVFTASSGGAGTVVASSLIGKPATFIPVGAVIKFIKDASAGAAPAHPIESYVTSFTPGSGTIAYSPNFAVNPAVLDRFEVTWSPAYDMTFGAGGVPANITAARLVSGVSLSEGQKWIEVTGDTVAAQVANVQSSSWQGFTVNVDLSSPTWNTVATHEVVNVTGDCELIIVVADSTDLVSTNATDSLRFQIATTASGGTTVLLWSCLENGFDVGERVPWLTAASAGPSAPAAGGLAYMIGPDAGMGGARFYSRSQDFGFEQVTASGVSGIMKWVILWRPVVMGSGATVVAGSGTPL